MYSHVRNVIVVALVVLVTAGVTTACSAEKPEPKTIEIIVPAGSRDRMRAGEYVVVMPAKLEMRVGGTEFEGGAGCGLGPSAAKAPSTATLV